MKIMSPCGLKMEFHEDGDDVVCIWNSADNCQGWLKTLHGGIQATMMDEIGGWIVCHKLQTAGMTVQLNMKYRHQVPAGEGVVIEIRGRIKELNEGKVCSSCEMIYCCFS